MLFAFMSFVKPPKNMMDQDGSKFTGQSLALIICLVHLAAEINSRVH